MRFKWRPGGIRRTGSGIVNTSKKAHLNNYGDNGQQDRWYGFSTYFPKDGMASDSFAEIVTQWHEPPDFSLGENWRTPPASLNIRNDRLTFGWKYDRRKVTPDSGQNLPHESVSLGAVPKDRWVDFVFHMKWDQFGHGVVQGWMDGHQVVDRHNASIGYNDTHAVLLHGDLQIRRQGAIHGPHQRVVYFDEVRIGDGAASYADVTPA